jgi:hypothetical protein
MKVLPQASDDMRRLGEHLEGRRTAMLSFSDEQGQITARQRCRSFDLHLGGRCGPPGR